MVFSADPTGLATDSLRVTTALPPRPVGPGTTPSPGIENLRSQIQVFLNRHAMSPDTPPPGCPSNVRGCAIFYLQAAGISVSPDISEEDALNLLASTIGETSFEDWVASLGSGSEPAPAPTGDVVSSLFFFSISSPSSLWLTLAADELISCKDELCQVILDKAEKRAEDEKQMDKDTTKILDKKRDLKAALDKKINSLSADFDKILAKINQGSSAEAAQALPALIGKIETIAAEVESVCGVNSPEADKINTVLTSLKKIEKEFEQNIQPA